VNLNTASILASFGIGNVSGKTTTSTTTTTTAPTNNIANIVVNGAKVGNQTIDSIT
jgi:hypothetical protein